MDKCYKKFTLTKVWRQENKIDANILSRIRLGKQTDIDLEYINRNVQPTAPLGAVVVTPLKLLEAEMNARKMAELTTEPVVLVAIREDDFKRNKAGYLPASPYADRIELKRGCRIMIKANVKCSTDEPKYKINVVNGDTGTFYGIDKKRGMIVELDRTKSIIYLKQQKAKNYKNVAVKKEVQEEDEDGNEITVVVDALDQKTTGVFTQYPIKVSYSSTVNGVQGATLERVHLHLGNSTPWEGIVYVALSRVRSFSCLTLDRPLTHDDIKTINGLREQQLDQEEMNI